MSGTYRIKEVTIELRPGVTVVAEVSSPNDLAKLLDDLTQAGLADERSQANSQVQADTLDTSTKDDSPENNIEVRTGLQAGTLSAMKIAAFKDGIPQLLRPNQFSSISDATLVLLYLIEIGLKQGSVSYDDFKSLFDGQGIKTGSPVPMLLTNLKNTGYIDKRSYSADRTIRLTAKGEKKAEEVITILAGQN